MKAREIARLLSTSPGAIYVQAGKEGLPPRAQGIGRPRKLPGSDSSGQRRFEGKVHDGEGARIVLAAHHPASRDGATLFGNSIVPAAQEITILKQGKDSRKLGDIVEKGRWKGQKIFCLTLEERHTCPRACLEWATCYGNGMPFAHRIMDDGTLLRRLWGELAALNARHTRGFVVRLHVLGDFYSVEYVEFWRQALIDFPALNVFGFSARWDYAQSLDKALLELVVDQGERFMIRFSGADIDTFGSQVVDAPEEARGILCPAQSDEKRSCASCALCMNSNRTITFLRH